MRSKWLLSGLVGLLFALPAAAQQSSSTSADQTTKVSTAVPDDAPQGTPPPDATQTPAATPPAAPTWSAGPIDFSGTIDGYYSFNFNHPRPGNGPGNSGATNVLYNFDIPTQQFSLNFAKLGMSHTADPVGFEFDLGYGDTMQQIYSVGAQDLFDQVVEQAFISFKPAVLKGFELDAGKFVTSAGAEVIESYSNWSYSRSLLFSWAIPYYHFGLRTSMPINKHWTAGFQVINGWNDTVDNNTAASLGANFTATYTKFTWTGVWYGGPENPGTNAGWRELFDTTLLLTPSSKINAYINYDYAWQTVYNNTTGYYPNNSKVNWDGIAAAIHWMPTGKLSFTGRYEWFSDPQGFAMFNANPAFDGDDPLPNTRAQEFTATVEYKFLEGLMWRGEYRYDHTNTPMFSKNGGCDPSDGLAGCANSQNTLTFAMIAYFGPKR